jgi:ubiquitin C-terminal hydrolase
MKGIYNIGNSCYLNSAVQMLFNSIGFRRLCTDTIFDKIIKDYDDSNTFNPKEIKYIVAKNNKMFDNYQQHDSYEFMIYLLDVLDKYKHNELYHLFGIKTRINIKCKLLNCLKESEHSEVELFLQLPLTNDLSESYRKYKAIEKLEPNSNNGYKCEKCNKITLARRKTITSVWPKHLLIVLKRFIYNHNQFIKDNKPINIPLIWRHNYKLKGGIIHSGVYGGGHYIYFGEKDNKWYLCNDTRINDIIDIEGFMKNNGAYSYMLHYIKLND